MANQHLLILAGRDNQGGGSIGNIKQGDIIDVLPETTVPDHEMRFNHLLVIVKNLTDEEAGMLTNILYEDGADVIEPNPYGPPVLVAKRKYSIPFSEIQIYIPTFDPARVEDPYDDYQPLYDNNIIPNAKQALKVYDKYTETLKDDWNPVISDGT